MIDWNKNDFIWRERLKYASSILIILCKNRVRLYFTKYKYMQNVKIE